MFLKFKTIIQSFRVLKHKRTQKRLEQPIWDWNVVAMGPKGHQSMVGVPKRTISLNIRWTPSLEHVISKLNGTFILKIYFSSYIHTLLRYYLIHSISNLNKFKDFQQVLEKFQDFVSLEKKSLKTHKECLKNLFRLRFLPKHLKY